MQWSLIEHRQVCWIPIFKAEKLILAGDPMQLPPTIISDSRDSQTTKTETKAGKPAKFSAETKNSPAKTAPPNAPPVERAESDGENTSVADEDGGESEGLEGDPAFEDGPLEESTKNTTTRRDSAKFLRPGGLRPPRSLETTLFDRLEKMYGSGIKRMLNVQYRYVRCLWGSQFVHAKNDFKYTECTFGLPLFPPK